MSHQYAIYRLDGWNHIERDGPRTLIRGEIGSWEDALFTASTFEKARPDQVFIVLNHINS